MSCQKEETTDKDCCVCRGCTQWQEGRWICCHCCCCCCYSQELHIISPLGGQIEGWLLHWWVQAGTLPCLKLTEWALTVWRVPRSAPRDRVATADCCIWPTYSSHRGGQNGLDYLSLWVALTYLRQRFSTRLLAVYHTHSPQCHTVQPARLTAEAHEGIHWVQFTVLSRSKSLYGSNRFQFKNLTAATQVRYQ